MRCRQVHLVRGFVWQATQLLAKSRVGSSVFKQLATLQLASLRLLPCLTRWTLVNCESF